MVIELVEMTYMLNEVVSINSTTSIKTFLTVCFGNPAPAVFFVVIAFLYRIFPGETSLAESAIAECLPHSGKRDECKTIRSDFTADFFEFVSA